MRFLINIFACGVSEWVGAAAGLAGSLETTVPGGRKTYRIRYHVDTPTGVHLAVHKVHGPLVSVLVDEPRHVAGDFVAEFQPDDPSELFYVVVRIGAEVTTQSL